MTGTILQRGFMKIMWTICLIRLARLAFLRNNTIRFAAKCVWKTQPSSSSPRSSFRSRNEPSILETSSSWMVENCEDVSKTTASQIRICTSATDEWRNDLTCNDAWKRSREWSGVIDGISVKIWLEKSYTGRCVRYILPIERLFLPAQSEQTTKIYVFKDEK